MTSPETKVATVEPGWTAVGALAMWLLSVLLVLFVPLLFVFPYAASLGFTPSGSAELGELLRSDPTAVVINVVGVLPAHILTLAAAWMVVTRRGRLPFLRSLGWEWNGFKVWHGATILVGFFALSSVVTQIVPEQEHELMRLLKSSRAAVYAVVLVATFTAPLVEEVVYRGVLYSAFERRMGKIGAVAIATFLFAVIHVPQYVPSYATIILIFLLSLTLTIVRAATDNLLPCVALHLVFNGLQSARLLADPLMEQAGRRGGDLWALFKLLT